MESGTKQSAISFSNGMSNVPNDLLCGDDSCSEVVGLTSENGEMKPIQKAEWLFDPPWNSNTYRLLYVHQTQTGKNYIYGILPSGNNSVWGLGYCKSTATAIVYPISTQLGDIDIDKVKVTSVGNTLIVTAPTGMKYILWKGDEADESSAYNVLGSRIPSPRPKFWLSGRLRAFDVFKTGGDCIGGGAAIRTITDQEKWNNVVIGGYSHQLEELREKNAFFAPFFALMALELYDGSYYMATSPVALYPNIETKYWGYFRSEDVRAEKLTCHLDGRNLSFTQVVDYSSDWSDIVKNVTIFVTEGVNPCDSTVDARCDNIPQGSQNNLSHAFLNENGHLNDSFYDPDIYSDDQLDTDQVFQLLRMKDADEIVREMSDSRVFYRLCDIGTSAVDTGKNTNDYISAHVLQNLTTQPRLDADGGEYFDHVAMNASCAYSYNGRLQLANIKRGFFDGFKQFISKDNGDTHIVEVAISTPIGWKKVTQSDVIGDVGYYFYYPDPRAKFVRIDGEYVFKLEEHHGLNGAFCIFNPLEYFSSNTQFVNDSLFISATEEPLPNKVLVSEVDNPFVFRARGYNTVGNGEVMAIASSTTALSEGQFGQFPLLAFSTDGIWALGTNATGTYSTVSPISREICNNAGSVTQTDSAIFFTSAKGLMVVVGSQVKCVSEQMNGKTDIWGVSVTPNSYIDFKDFLDDCTIAYDYRDSALWIFNKNLSMAWHYVYNIKSGTFSKVWFDEVWANAVNDYPDTLLQDVDGFVYSLLERPDQNDDISSYQCHITTRPLKFGNSLTLKSIRQIKHLMNIGLNSRLTIRVYASNNLRQWVELESLRGMPWKYYRLKYSFSNLKAPDRFIGTVFVTQERRTEKLR